MVGAAFCSGLFGCKSFHQPLPSSQKITSTARKNVADSQSINPKQIYQIIVTGSVEESFVADTSHVYFSGQRMGVLPENLYILESKEGNRYFPIRKNSDSTIQYPRYGRATFANLEKIITYLSKNTEQGDLIILTLLSHGNLVKSNKEVQDDVTQAFYLYSETDPPEITTGTDPLLKEKFLSLLQRLKANTILVTGACYGGGFAEAGTCMSSFAGLSACGGTESAYASIGASFPIYVFESFHNFNKNGTRLADANCDGMVSLDEAFNYAYNKVLDFTSRPVDPSHPDIFPENYKPRLYSSGIDPVRSGYRYARSDEGWVIEAKAVCD